MNRTVNHSPARRGLSLNFKSTEGELFLSLYLVSGSSACLSSPESRVFRPGSKDSLEELEHHNEYGFFSTARGSGHVVVEHEQREEEKINSPDSR